MQFTKRYACYKKLILSLYVLLDDMLTFLYTLGRRMHIFASPIIHNTDVMFLSFLSPHRKVIYGTLFIFTFSPLLGCSAIRPCCCMMRNCTMSFGTKTILYQLMEIFAWRWQSHHYITPSSPQIVNVGICTFVQQYSASSADIFTEIIN